MRADPVRQALRRGRLGVGVVGGVRDGDEDLRRPDLAGAAVEQIDGLAGMIDEHALAGGMSLARRRRRPAFPRRGTACASGCSDSRQVSRCWYSAHSSISMTPGRRTSS